MKKGFFTTVLAAALSVSAIIPVSAKSSDVTIDAAFSANTGDEVLHEYDFRAEYTFHNKSNGTNNWDNFILEIRTEENVGKNAEGEEAPVYIDFRADHFGWLANQTDDAELVWDSLPEDFSWEDYVADMQEGMDCSVYITRHGNTFTISMSATIGYHTKYMFDAEVTANDFEGQRSIIHLTGENCELTNVYFTHNITSAPPAFGDSTSDVTIGPAFSANTGDEVLEASYADVTYTFHNQSTGTNNWDNFILEIRTERNVGKNAEGEEVPVYIDLRADHFGWLANQTDETAALVWEELPEGFTWDEYAADMQAGMDCIVRIKRNNNTFTIEINEGGKYFFNAKTTINDFQGQKAVIHLTGENCILSNVKLGHSVIHIPTNPIDPTDPANPTDPADPTKPTTQEPSDPEVKEPVRVSVGDEELKATVSKDNAPEGATITVAEVTDKAEIEKAENAIKAKFTEVIRRYAVLDINMMVGSEKKQPLNNGKVLVTLDIPSVLNAAKAAIYRMEEDGSLTELKSTVKDKTISFETDHFSTYVIAEKAASAEVPTTTKAPETTKPAAATTTAKTTATTTGDSAPIAALIAVAAAACAAVIVSRRKETR